MNVNAVARGSVLALCAALSTAAPLHAEEGDSPKPQYGFEVGKRLPLLIVDFAAGPHKDHCGCPAIMVRNQRTRGVVILSRTSDPRLIELAQALEAKAVDGQRLHGFFVLFGRDGIQLADAASQAGLVKFNAGQGRGTAAGWLKSVGLGDDIQCAVCLLDRDGIRAAWKLASASLSVQQFDEIVQAAEALAQDEAPSQKRSAP